MPMRLVPVSIALIVGLSACGENAETTTNSAGPPTFVSGEAEASPSAGASISAEVAVPSAEVVAPQVEVEAAHGGSIAMAGPHAVEVVAHESGQVYAYPPSTVATPAEAKLNVAVPVKGGGEPRSVAMRWAPAKSRYEGSVRRVEIEPGPIAVHYIVDDHLYECEVVLIALAPAIVVETPVVVYGKHKKHKKHKHHKHKGRGGYVVVY